MDLLFKNVKETDLASVNKLAIKIGSSVEYLPNSGESDQTEDERIKRENQLIDKRLTTYLANPTKVVDMEEIITRLKKRL